MDTKDESYPSHQPAVNNAVSSPTDRSSVPSDRSNSAWDNYAKKLGVITALLGAGYIFGGHVAESKAHEAMASLQANTVVMSAELARSKAELSNLSNAYSELQQRTSQKETQIAQLTAAAGIGRNCDYLRQQIAATKREIQYEQSSMNVQLPGEKNNQQEKTNVARLDANLSQLIDKFGECIKRGD